MIEHFHFLRPLWLLLLPPLFWLLWRVWHRQSQGGAWQAVCDPHLLPHLLVGTTTRNARTPIVLLGLAGILTIVALAGPVWAKLSQPVYRNSAATVVLLNLSDTMNASDVTPSRLERAKLKLLDFLRRQREGQIALVAYAGEAYVVSPLSDDAATIASLVPPLKSALMPVQGNHLSEALHKAGELLDQAGVARGGHILLISDSAGDSATLDSAAALSKKGRVLAVLGVGTGQGAPISAPDGGFIKDDTGAILVPKLNTDSLTQLATAGQGRFVTLTTSDDDLNQLWPAERPTSLDPERKGQDHVADVWREEGPWLLLLVLPLAALSLRRGWLGVVLIAVIGVPHPAQAFEWHDLWARPDQQAYQALQHGDAKTAARLFKDPRWQSVAQYRAGDYTTAATGFGNVPNPDALYNQGNALARAGKLQAAAEAYRKALQQQPANADAKHNLKLVEDLLKKEQQDKSSQQDKNSEQKNGEDKNSQDKKSQQAKDQAEQNKGKDQQQKDSAQSGKYQQHDQQNAQKNKDNTAASQTQQESADKKDAHNKSTENKPEDDKAQSQAKKDSEADKSMAAAQEAKDKEAKDKQAAQQQAPATDSPNGKDQKQAAIIDKQLPAKTEADQALEQWLRRIPDDPGGLLQRKFMLQHQQREQQ